MNEDKKKCYQAEIRFLRAYDYYNKVMFYGDIPLIDKVIESAADANLARTPKSEVVQFILNELTEITNQFPVQNVI